LQDTYSSRKRSRTASFHGSHGSHGSHGAERREREREREREAPLFSSNAPVDRTNTPPFLIRAFPYVVSMGDIEVAKKPEEAPGARKPIGAAGLTKAYRPPDAYMPLFSPTGSEDSSEPGLEEIRVYTYADATLESVVDEIKEEMGKRGLLRDDAGTPGISVAAAWEEWHRNDEKFFMRCRSVGKVGMDEAWARGTRPELGVDARGFPDKRASTLRSLNWKVGDAMDVCFLYA